MARETNVGRESGIGVAIMSGKDLQGLSPIFSPLVHVED